MQRSSQANPICVEHWITDIENNNHYIEELPLIVDKIVESTKLPNSPDHIGSPMIPSKESLIEILDIIETIVYPGYFGNQELDHKNIHFYIGNQVNKLFRILSSQISKCLIHECKSYKTICNQCKDVGKEETIKFLNKIPQIREILAGDIEATFEGDPAAKGKEEIIFCYPGMKAITIYRIAHELFIQKIPILPRMLTEYAHSITGADIHPGAKIGRNFFIDHATGVVIGETTEIADNVRIYQGVTLGALSIPKGGGGNALRNKKRHPTIEDDVIIYANATILGGDTVIGKGSIIGGNVWLTHSVPPNSRVSIPKPELEIKVSNKQNCK